MPENRKLKVFLCHSKDDKPKVRELYHRLVVDGFDAWLDEEKLMPGQDWDLEIRKAVRESDVVVVCLSKSSTTKAGYVQKEIRFALDIADEQPEGVIYLIPARLEDCQVPSRLDKWQWVNLYEKAGLEKLWHTLELRCKSLGIEILLSIDPQIQKKTMEKLGSTKRKAVPFTEIECSMFEPQMVRIPAGKFLMGSTDEQIAQIIKDGLSQIYAEWEQPQHTVELSEYSIGKYPITNREYQAFVRDANRMQPWVWDRDQFPTGKGEHPVVYVSWDDAVAYCKWLSEKSGKQYRLPTEAEWEKAARGDDGRIYPWGNEFDPKKANTHEIRVRDTSDIGNFSPQGDSPYGCADMIGNVREWCNDWFIGNEYEGRVGKSIKDPQGLEKKEYLHAVRGGSYSSNLRFARCAIRGGDLPLNARLDIGFRVASSPI